LNSLVHSIPNVIQGNTILNPYHSENNELKTFEYIVSNPPFNLDFSEYRDQLDSKENKERFFAGIPNIAPTKPESMSIYLLFIQHIIFSLKDSGKAAIVVPKGFITAKSGIEKKLRQSLIDRKMLAGVINMPPNIFATTTTNVCILFLDKKNKEEVILIDASKLGVIVGKGKKQKTLLTKDEESLIINTFNKRKVIEDFSILKTYEDISSKNYSLNAGRYFEIVFKNVDITENEFKNKITKFKNDIDENSKRLQELDKEIKINLEKLTYEK